MAPCRARRIAASAPLLLLAARASQLRNDPLSLCVAHGNGTTFNITALPWESFVFHDSDRGYAYTLSSPCAERSAWTHACPAFADNTTVLCQRDHLNPSIYYDCGGVAQPPVWLLNGWGPPYFSVLFGGGNNWRLTNVTFVVDATLDVPVATFLSESPYLQYNVEVRGRCVGQPWGCSRDFSAPAPFALEAGLAPEPVAGFHAMHVNATGGSCCSGDCLSLIHI